MHHKPMTEKRESRNSSMDDEKQHRLEFASIIESLGVVYDRQITDDMLAVYFECLRDIPIWRLKAIAASHVACNRFWPTPSELRGVNPSADAVRAWDTANAAIHIHGMYRHVDFDDSVVNATIRHLGGWPEFCARDPKDETWTRKEFIQTYKSLAASGLTAEQAAPLAGISEANQVERKDGRVIASKVVVRKVAAPKLINSEGGEDVWANEKARIRKN